MLCDGKSPGVDGLLPEVIKRGGKKLVEVLYTIMKDAWENIEISADWKVVQPVTIPKKRNRWDWGNYLDFKIKKNNQQIFILFSFLISFRNKAVINKI